MQLTTDDFARACKPFIRALRPQRSDCRSKKACDATDKWPPRNDSILLKTMLIGFGDAAAVAAERSGVANLWRTCVRSLIHDIPPGRPGDGGRWQSCLPGQPAGRDRSTSLIFIVTPPAPVRDPTPTPAAVFPARPDRELWIMRRFVYVL